MRGVGGTGSFTLGSRFERSVTKLPGSRSVWKDAQCRCTVLFLSGQPALARQSGIGAQVKHLDSSKQLGEHPEGRGAGAIRVARKGLASCARWR